MLKKTNHINPTLEKSSRTPSKILNLSNLNTNIMNYLKYKGVKYHIMTNSKSNNLENKEISDDKCQTLPSSPRDKKKKEDIKLHLINKNDLDNSNYNTIMGNNKQDSLYFGYNKSMSQRLNNDTKIKKCPIESHRRSFNERSKYNLVLQLIEDDKNKYNNNVNKKGRKNYFYSFDKNELNNKDNQEIKTKNNSYDKISIKSIQDTIPINLQNEQPNINIFKYNQNNDKIHSDKKRKFIKFIHHICSILKKDKKIFLKELKKKSNIQEILNYKPIIKEKTNNLNNSLEFLNNNFLTTNDNDDKIGVKQNYNIKEGLELIKTFSNIESVNTESFSYRGRKYINLEKNELNKYKGLYEQSLRLIKNIQENKKKSFGFLYIRRKVINFKIPSQIITSYKNIEIDFPEEGDFEINPIKKQIEIQRLINNFNIYGIKKNPYLPFMIKDSILKYCYKLYSEYFFKNLKNLCIKNTRNKYLKKIIHRNSWKKLQRYFRKFYHRILLFQYINERNIERENNLISNRIIEFKIENAIYDISVITQSFNDLSFLKSSHNKNNNSIQEIKNQKLKLDYIKRPRKIRYKYPFLISKIRNNLMKNIQRKKIKTKSRLLNFIDKKDPRNASLSSKKLYRPIKYIKKIFDDSTGKFYKYNDNKNSFIKSSDSKSLTGEKESENEILDEKIMKLLKVLNINLFSHSFKVWKYITKKDKKPKFYDIIIIMMKCVFIKNKMIRNAFMGETYFYIGKNIFIWYWNTIGRRIKKERKKKQKKMCNK